MAAQHQNYVALKEINRESFASVMKRAYEMLSFDVLFWCFLSTLGMYGLTSSFIKGATPGE